MGPVLAELGVRHLSVCRMAMTCVCLVVGVPVAVANYQSSRVTEADAQQWLSDGWLAKERCDVRWFEEHILPGAQLTFVLFEGEHQRTERPTLAQHLEQFRNRCRYSWFGRGSADRVEASVAVGAYGTTVRRKWNGVQCPPFYWDCPTGISSYEETVTFVATDAGPKLQELSVVEVK